MTVRFLAEAEVELADGVAYYDGLLSGLGIEFASEVRDGLARVGGSTAFLVAKRKLAQMHFRTRGAGRHAMTAPGSTTSVSHDWAARRGRSPLRFIRRILDRRKVRDTLPDYPVYSPPFSYGKSWNTIPPRNQIEQNYEYFLRRKADRLKHLTAYLAPFSVELRLGRWLYRYGGHLVPDGGDVISALARYEPAWVGEYHGLNIVNDVAIFAGDYIVSKNKGAHWDVWYRDGTKLSNEMEGFGMPCICGLNHLGYRGHFSILHELHRCCAIVRYRSKHGNVPAPPWDKPGEFERLLNHLSDANAPDPVPFSQLNMDELN